MLTLNPEMLDAYVECALWSSTGDTGTPLDQSPAALSLSARERMAEMLAGFLSANAGLLADAMEETGNDATQVAHDLWLTQNRHGAGFWDGDWNGYGDALTDAAHAIGECDLYVGDDGLIYLA